MLSRNMHNLGESTAHLPSLTLMHYIASKRHFYIDTKARGDAYINICIHVIVLLLIVILLQGCAPGVVPPEMGENSRT